MPSIAKVQASNLDFLDKQARGLDINDPQELKLNNVEAVLIEWAGAFIEQAAANLQQSRAVDTGGLVAGMKYFIDQSNGVYTLTVKLPDYYDFVNKGVKGVKSSSLAPRSPYQFRTLTVSSKMESLLQKWINRGNRKAKVQNKTFPGKKTRTFSGSAYGLGIAIKRKGLRATYFFDKAFDKIYPTLAPKLAEAFAEDVVTVIKNINVRR